MRLVSCAFPVQPEHQQHGPQAAGLAGGETARTHEHHGHALRDHEREVQVAHLALPQRVHALISGLALRAAVPAVPINRRLQAKCSTWGGMPEILEGKWSSARSARALQHQRSTRVAMPEMLEER